MKPYFQNVLYPLNLQARAYIVESLNYTSHWHVDVEMVYVLKGSLKVGIDGIDYILHENDFSIISSRQLHSYESDEKQNELIIAMFNPAIIGHPDGWPKEKVLRNTAVITSQLQSEGDVQALSSIKLYLENLVDETRNFNNSSDYFMLSKLYEICGLCLRHFSSDSTEHDRDNSAKSGDIRIIFSILNYLDKNYSHPLTLAGVSEHFNFSPSYLCRLFRRTTGTSFSDYLVNIRMQQVKNLLRSSDNSITDIAYECGFENLRTFNRIFKNTNGITPSEFRKQR